MSALLVTGGSGFVGKSILDAYSRGLLRPFGILKLIVVARRATRLRELSPQLLGPDVELVDVDIRNLGSLFGAAMVIHAAASANASDYQSDPDAERSVIEDGTRNILQLTAGAMHPVKLLYVSSGAVYGKQSPDVLKLREDSGFEDETDPGRRTYTEAKRAAEALVQDAAKRFTLSASIARCFAFVGPWLPRDRHFAVGNFLAHGLAGEPITVTATHEVIRSYMYADDLVEWLMTICLNGNDGCPVFNVGSDEAVSILDLATLIGQMFNVSVNIPKRDLRAAADRYLPDVSRARLVLGLVAKTQLMQAVEASLPKSARASSPLTQQVSAEVKHLYGFPG